MMMKVMMPDSRKVHFVLALYKLTFKSTCSVTSLSNNTQRIKLKALKKMGKVGLLDQPADPSPPHRKLVHLKVEKFDVYFAF